MLQIDRSLFPRVQEVAYLDTAAEGLPPATARGALERYFEAKTRGTPGRGLLHETERAAAASTARLLGTEADNVAFLAHASDGLNLLANSIEWNSGDEVVITDLEFPSNVSTWLRLAARGVSVRVVNSDKGLITLDAMTCAMTSRTRVVSISHVSYKTGTKISFLAELAAAAHERGAVFCLDATQSLGRLPVPLEGVDFLVSSSYKWLLGVHGLGIVYLAPGLRQRLSPATAGWYSIENIFAPDRFERFRWKPGAACLQAGMPSFCAIFVLCEAVQYLLSVGVECIDAGLQPLVARLRHGIEQLGFDLLTPAGAGGASGIVSFTYPEPEELGAQLARENIVVWAGDGRVRSSVHLYNSQADIDHLLDALSRMGEPT